MHLVVGGQRKSIGGMRDGGKEVRNTSTRAEGNCGGKVNEKIRDVAGSFSFYEILLIKIISLGRACWTKYYL